MKSVAISRNRSENNTRVNKISLLVAPLTILFLKKPFDLYYQYCARVYISFQQKTRHATYPNAFIDQQTKGACRSLKTVFRTLKHISSFFATYLSDYLFFHLISLTTTPPVQNLMNSA